MTVFDRFNVKVGAIAGLCGAAMALSPDAAAAPLKTGGYACMQGLSGEAGAPAAGGPVAAAGGPVVAGGAPAAGGPVAGGAPAAGGAGGPGGPGGPAAAPVCTASAPISDMSGVPIVAPGPV